MLLLIYLIINMFSRFDCTKDVDNCRGFLIDGELAVKWRELSGFERVSVCGWNFLVSEPPGLTPFLGHDALHVYATSGGLSSEG